LIGVFDSGVGGLSVLSPLRRALPGADILYLADRAHAPYGERSLGEVRRLAERCTSHLLAEGASTVVIACNTASAAALHHLRRLHPAVAFVGMEPALKPAAGITRSGVVGVLATEATFQGELFSSLLDRYAGGLEVVTQACPGWAAMVEQGTVAGPEVRTLISTHLAPVLDQGADTLVLGCTHYPFLLAEIAAVAGPTVTIIDPSPAVAAQAARVAAAHTGTGATTIHTTGSAASAAAVITGLTGLAYPVSTVTLA
jgi:glutamate racemase